MEEQNKCKMKKMPIAVLCSAVLFLSCGPDSAKNKNSISTSSQGYRESLLHHYPLSVSNRIVYFSDYLKSESESSFSKRSEEMRKSATEFLANDICYLHFLGEGEGGDYARQVSEAIAYAFRKKFLDDEQLFSKDRLLHLVLPNQLGGKVEISPREVFNSISLSREREEELADFFSENWK